MIHQYEVTYHKIGESTAHLKVVRVVGDSGAKHATAQKKFEVSYPPTEYKVTGVKRIR